MRRAWIDHDWCRALMAVLSDLLRGGNGKLDGLVFMVFTEVGAPKAGAVRGGLLRMPGRAADDALGPPQARHLEAAARP